MTGAKDDHLSAFIIRNGISLDTHSGLLTRVWWSIVSEGKPSTGAENLGGIRYTLGSWYC